MWNDGRLLDPKRAKDPRRVALPKDRLDSKKIRGAFEEAVKSARVADRARAMYALVDGRPRGSLIAEPTMAKALAPKGFTRQVLKHRVVYELARPVDAMPCKCFFARADDSLVMGFTVSAYTEGTLGGPLSLLTHARESKSLWATNEAELAPLVNMGLELFESFREAIARTPLPALSRRGRITSKWPTTRTSRARRG